MVRIFDPSAGNADHSFSSTGAYDASYLSTWTDLEGEELLGKVVVLQGSDEPPDEWRQLALPFMQIEGLFMTHKPFSSLRRPGPVHLVGLNHNVTTTGGLISPQSESEPSVNLSSQGSGRTIDPTKVSQHGYSYDAMVLDIFEQPLHKRM